MDQCLLLRVKFHLLDVVMALHLRWTERFTSLEGNNMESVEAVIKHSFPQRAELFLVKMLNQIRVFRGNETICISF